MNEIKIVIYNDFCARVYKEISKEQLVDDLAIITAKPTGGNYFPIFYDKSKKGRPVKFWVYEFEKKNIKLKNGYAIIDIFEQPENKDYSGNIRNYYRKITFRVTDSFNHYKDYNQYILPENFISNDTLNKIFSEIKEDLVNTKFNL